MVKIVIGDRKITTLTKEEALEMVQEMYPELKGDINDIRLETMPGLNAVGIYHESIKELCCTIWEDFITNWMTRESTSGIMRVSPLLQVNLMIKYGFLKIEE